MTVRSKTVWGLAALCGIVLLAGCKSGNDSGGPMTGPSGGGSSTTITITSSGVSPKSVTVSRGSQVTFVNNDTRTHDMASDPHPTHTDCPEINTVGFLAASGPTKSKQTSNLNTAGTCHYHDHELFFDTSLQGTIVIQ
jgi:plastocyanin